MIPLDWNQSVQLALQNTLLSQSRPKRVLVVDDSALQRKILVTSLLQWGYEVEEADSARTALQVCARALPDMVISDWIMPGMSGLEFCRAFRALPIEKYVYFILLTAKNESDAVVEALGGGADDFLTKPVNTFELRARLNAGERIINMQNQLTEKNKQISTNLKQIQTLYDSLEQDLSAARKFQQSLIKNETCEYGQMTVSTLLEPSGHVGGDLVGSYPIGSHTLGVFALDVSGHGVASALMTARLASYLSPDHPEQNIAQRKAANGIYVPLDTDKAVTKLNQCVLQHMDTDHYFTLVLAHINLMTGRVQMTQAGHPHPVMITANGNTIKLGDGGLPVGLIPEAEFTRFELQLKLGDKLVLASDGFIECQNAKGEMLQQEGFIKMVGASKDKRGSEFMREVQKNLHDYCGSRNVEDDISMLTVDYG